MTIKKFLETTDLEHSLLIGYYGGGNFGDELLLEVLQNKLASQGVQQAEIAYMPYAPYKIYHHDYGYKHFTANSPLKLIGGIDRSRQVLVGGGGIWGLDAVLQVFLMSVALFIARWFFGKQVYLLGVGYYGSTTWLGHFSAWLAGISSTHIIGRDAETVQNFRRFTKQVSLDKDMAWLVKDIDPAVYRHELAVIEQDLPVKDKTLFVTLRRFNDRHHNNYTQLIGDALAKYQDRPAIVMLLEPRVVDMAGYATLEIWQKRYEHIKVADFRYNPVALYLFLQKYRKQLTVLSPQFHAILCAHLAGVPFLPLVYDNKSQHMLASIGYSSTVSIYDLQPTTIEQFIEETAL